MATFTPTTLAGGVKAPRFMPGVALTPSLSAPLACASASPCPSDFAVAFAVMSDLVAEAAQAEARLVMSASWDIAFSAITSEDMEAYEAAIIAAGALLHMPLSRISDRPLARTARFIHRSLMLETAEARAKVRLAITGSRSVFTLEETYSMGQENAEMVSRALQRLDALLAVLDVGSSPVLDPSTGCRAEVTDDADQEVQAFR